MATKFYAFEMVGIAGETFRVAADDTSNNLIDDGGLSLKNASGKVVTSAIITCETNAVRISFVAAADQTGGSEVGHVLQVGSSFLVSGAQNIINLRYINETNGSNGVMQVTPRYGE